MYLKLVFLGVLSVVASEKVRYDNYLLYKVHPNNEEHVGFLEDLQSSDLDLDFWKPAGNVGEFVSVVTPPEKRKEFEELLAKENIFSELMQENIQETLDAQLQSRRKRNTRSELYWTNYQTNEEIIDWFHHLATVYSDVVTLIDAGASYEGRNRTGIKIARGSPSRVFFIEAGQVGADWLSPTVVTYLVDKLVRGEDDEARRASEEFEWHVFPVVNPDGLQYSQDAERFWVKNRNPVGSSAVGVDLTKNWNSQWGVSGGSHTPSANNYIGQGPFSEVETREMSCYIESIGSRLTGFLSFRAFGQRLVVPFAHSTEPLYNYNEMITIGRRAMGSLAVKYNTQYLVGTSKQVLDGATGSIVDWAKHRFNPTIAATFYLRDLGAWGYTLPITQITPACEETYDALLAMLREARFINAI